MSCSRRSLNRGFKVGISLRCFNDLGGNLQLCAIASELLDAIHIAHCLRGARLEM
jgi:hypothetical protein